jgi:hypothetical protein
LDGWGDGVLIETEYYFPSTSPGGNKAVGDFVSKIMFGEPGLLNNYSSMGVVKDGKLIAGVLFQEYYAGSGTIELSAASTDRSWMTRRVVHDMFSMPFEVLGAHLVIVKTAEDNTTVRDISTRCGLTEYYIPDLRGPGLGEFIYTMSRGLWYSLPYSRAGR